MIKNILKSGYSIHAYAVILEKISFFLITIYLIKKLSIEDLAIFTQLFIYGGMYTLFVDMGTSMLFVNYAKEYSANFVFNIRAFLFSVSVVSMLILFDNYLMILFISLFILDSLSKFPQYFQIRQYRLNIYYTSQIIKAILLIFLAYYWSQNEVVYLFDSLILLSSIYAITIFYIVIPFIGKVFRQAHISFKHYLNFIKDGKYIFISQFLFMVKLSLPLYLISIYFQEYLKEFRVYIMVFSIFQQSFFIYFAGLYPKLVNGSSINFQKKTIFFIALIFFVGSIIAFGMKDTIWQIIFSDITQTEYQNLLFFIVLASLPLSIIYLWYATIFNAKKRFNRVLYSNIIGALFSIMLCFIGLYYKEYIFILVAFIIFDFVAIIYLRRFDLDR